MRRTIMRLAVGQRIVANRSLKSGKSEERRESRVREPSKKASCGYTVNTKLGKGEEVSLFEAVSSHSGAKARPTLERWLLVRIAEKSEGREK